MTQYYYIQPGETIPAAHLAALQAAGVVVATAAPPSGPLSAGMVWAEAAPALVSGVLTQQWTQVMAPVVPLAAQAQALLAAGCAVESASTPALNGVYPLMPSAIADLTALVAGVSASEGLPNAASTVTLLDVTGAPHEFSATQLVACAAAIRNVFYQCQMILAGQATTLPAQPAMIA